MRFFRIIILEARTFRCSDGDAILANSSWHRLRWRAASKARRAKLRRESAPFVATWCVPAPALPRGVRLRGAERERKKRAPLDRFAAAGKGLQTARCERRLNSAPAALMWCARCSMKPPISAVANNALLKTQTLGDGRRRGSKWAKVALARKIAVPAPHVGRRYNLSLD
jgi:hypothetical protein